MNERIKELALKAGMTTTHLHYGRGPDPYVLWGENDIETFAELIVQECAKVCSEQRDPSNLNYKPSEKFSEAVKHHFGVF